VISRAVTPAPAAWETARGAIRLDRPLVVGILNVTPDSFSDGGRFLEPDAALRHAESLVAAGADLLDLGGESTRPGAPAPVPAQEEWRRLAPVIEAVSARFPAVPLSVDTMKSGVAERALDAGAWILNDVSGLRHDARLAEVCAAAGAGLVLMHSRGTVSEMATYRYASYDDVTAEVTAELADAVRRAEERGVPAGAVVVDPGLGFAKRPEHNLALLDRLEALAALGRPILVGPSRKRFLALDADRPPEERDVATAAACVLAYERGAALFRVHDVATAREALDLAHAVKQAGEREGGRAGDRRSAGPPVRRGGEGGGD
jgi:dihydropteroate synthase